AAEDRLDPRWLVPAMWIWVNVHGSFPLGLLAVALVAVGRHLDGESAAVEWRSLKWAVGGTLLGALNPIGPRLLVFPVELLSRQDVLSNVREWQAPTFTRFGQRAFLALVAVALVALVRKPSWRAGLPLIVFLVAALRGSRTHGPRLGGRRRTALGEPRARRCDRRGRRHRHRQRGAGQRVQLRGLPGRGGHVRRAARPARGRRAPGGPGLRRQLPRGALRPEREGVLRRPVRHVPRPRRRRRRHAGQGGAGLGPGPRHLPG